MKYSRYALLIAFIFLCEVIYPRTWYVNGTTNIMDGSGSSWDSPLKELQEALQLSIAGDVIWVASGTYYPTSTNDRTANFRLKSGVTLYGGFDGSEQELADRNIEAHETILSGNIGDKNSYLDNSYHVVKNVDVGIDSVASIDGFTITGGNATDPEPYERGGGMFNKNSRVSIVNCTFIDNRASYGGALYNLASSKVDIYDCLFRNNTAERVGGGIYNFLRCDVVIDRSIIVENQAIEDFAGALYNFQSNLDIYNSLISLNRAPHSVLFYNTNFSEVRFYNVNMILNESLEHPLFSLENNSTAKFYNSLIWSNSGPTADLDSNYYHVNDESEFHYENSFVENVDINQDSSLVIEEWLNQKEVKEEVSNLIGTLEVTDSILVHPYFINNGNSIYNSLPKDILGNPRIDAGQIDIGMIELSSELTTGSIDLKAHEFIMYPNPLLSPNRTLTIQDEIFNITKVEMYDRSGRRVTKWSDPIKNGNEINLTIPLISEGEYYLKIHNSDKFTLSGTIIIIN